MKTTRSMFKGLLGGGILLLVFTFVGQAAAQTWIELAPTGGPPEARVIHNSVYDTATNRMIVFGGSNATQMWYVPPEIALRNDVWVLENADGLGGTPAWTQLIPNGAAGSPTKRAAQSSVYDPATNRLIMFGGNPQYGSCYADVNDVWVLENADGHGGTSAAWMQLIPHGAAGSPSKRAGHSAVYDPGTNRMIMFGGNDECTPVDATKEVWVLENANGLGGTPNWIQLSPTGTRPGARAHTAVYDQRTNRMIAMIWTSGGDEVWVLENANGLGGTPNWIQLTPTGGPPDRRYGHSAVFDPATNKMTVFGGCCGGTNPGSRFSDVWVLENANGLGGTPNWTQLFPASDPVTGPPFAREFHTAVYNPATSRMTVFGGTSCVSGGSCLYQNEWSTLNDIWVLTDANGIATVAIDIKPGSFPNSINPRSKGVIPVAILTTDSFDATNVDPLTVVFGPNGAVEAHGRGHIEDADGDGDLDLVLHFRTQETGIQCGDTAASLTGETFGGQLIEGSDSISTVGCK